MPETPVADPEMSLVRLSAAVYAQRDGKILILKRATGELTGAWFLPSGGVDHGEPVEHAALRELFEESGLVPSGPLTLVGLARMHVYGVDSLQIAYACDCPEGEIRLSDEHSGALDRPRRVPRAVFQRRSRGRDRITKQPNCGRRSRRSGAPRRLPPVARGTRVASRWRETAHGVVAGARSRRGR